MRAIKTTAWISAALAIAGFTPAHAQDWGDAPRERERYNGDHTVIGIGVAHVPAFQGGDDYRTLPVPVIDIAAGPIFANLRNGIGLNVVDGKTLTIGGGVALMPGYRRRDVPEGVRRLSFGAGGRMFAHLNAGGFMVTIGGTQGFAGSTKGFIADASVAYPIAASERLSIIPAVATTWADRKHTNRYFGIDTREAYASGLPEYRAGKGFKDVSVTVTANYRLTDRINLSATGGLTTLLGDAKDSPLVEHETQPSGFLALSYRFGR